MSPLFNRIAITVMQAGAALTFMSGITTPAHAAEPSACVSARCSLDARLAAKADESPAALRRYVDRTRMIYQLDVSTAATRAEQYRSQRDAEAPR